MFHSQYFMDNEMVQLANGHLLNGDEWRSHASKSVYGFTGFYFCRVCYAHEFFAFIYPRVLISKLNGRKIIGSMAMRLTSKLMCARQTSDRVTLEPVLNALCFAIYRHSNKARLEGFLLLLLCAFELGKQHCRAIRITEGKQRNIFFPGPIRLNQNESRHLPMQGNEIFLTGIALTGHGITQPATKCGKKIL